MTLSKLQAQLIARSGRGCQCWGVEFRGQGRLTAPPGNLLDMYMRDLLAVTDAMGLRGAFCDTTVKCSFVRRYSCIYIGSYALAEAPSCALYIPFCTRPLSVLQAVKLLRTLEGLK